MPTLHQQLKAISNDSFYGNLMLEALTSGHELPDVKSMTETIVAEAYFEASSLDIKKLNSLLPDVAKTIRKQEFNRDLCQSECYRMLYSLDSVYSMKANIKTLVWLHDNLRSFKLLALS